MALVNLSNIGILSAQSDNRGRVDHNDVDISNSTSWNRTRGHRAKGKGHKCGHKGSRKR